MQHYPGHTNRKLLFYTFYLAFICAGVISILPGPTLSILASHTGVTLSTAGWIFSASSVGFLLGVVLCMLLEKRISPKQILIIGLGLMSLAAMLVPFTSSFSILLAIIFMQGIGFSFIDVSINIMATLAFTKTLGETLNNLHSSYGIGALIGPLLLSITLETLHGPQGAFLGGSLVGLVCIVMLIFQRVPGSQKKTATSGASNDVGKIKPMTIFKHGLIWMMACQIFLYVGTEAGFSNWIVTAVSKGAGITLAIAAPTATLFWLGLTLGRLLGGLVLKRQIMTETRLLYVSIFGGGLSGLLAAASASQFVASLFMSLCVGIFIGPVYPSVLAIASRRFMHAAGLVSSVMLISSSIGSMLIPVLIGFLIPLLGVSRGMTIPALICLLIAPPFALANILQQRTLQSSEEVHTIEEPTQVPLAR